MARYRVAVFVLIFSVACAVSGRQKSPSFAAEKTSPVYEIVIDRVLPNTPAERGGIKSGDQILKINDEAVFSHKGFLDALGQLPNGEKSRFTILRNDRKINIAFFPGKGRYRFGFRFITRDPEINRKLKFNIWPEEVDPKLKKFTIFFQTASLSKKNSRSPQMRVLYRLKEILHNKGYIFTEDPANADFIIETEYKYPDSDSASARALKKRKLPFEAIRILFREKTDTKPFLKVSGRLDIEKAKIYGAKGYIYAMLDAMLEKYPSYEYLEKSGENLAATKRKIADDKSSSSEKRFPAASPF